MIFNGKGFYIQVKGSYILYTGCGLRGQSCFSSFLTVQSNKAGFLINVFARVLARFELKKRVYAHAAQLLSNPHTKPH